ncbi:MAG TPA: PQQ-binding-like beta-propeller repeat protein, partial [Sedimentisphaerales bacterium]|nr:PQQ-binding-like beta-propeller repeat protein [Sedimentisphaerales bacterium]
MNRPAASFILCALLTVCLAAGAEDWPTFNHDNRRSGVTPEEFAAPLVRAWTLQTSEAPAPAWPGPAKQDYWHGHYDLRATLAYDCAFGVVGAGDTLYFGSSAGKVYALDVATGRLKWSFFAEGPVRLSPVVVGDRVYVGSDDGCVYCLSAGDGSAVWKLEAAPDSRFIPGNGEIISLRP